MNRPPEINRIGRGAALKGLGQQDLLFLEE